MSAGKATPWQDDRIGPGESLRLGRFEARIEWESGNYRATFGQWSASPARSAHVFRDAAQAREIALKLARKLLTDALRALDDAELAEGGKDGRG